ncbi:hypothetical protein B1T45_20385 [Mycobacterium kansasii]|uniref:Uncharacterized protein n=1 Tax=Mycobacterium kansasii ATCC 12478 TaxID=557599 RepID=U5X1S8_MYCKA|nr:hypothetical protein MKAN_09240 [Mycobacterium kansasii ATCC 12478]ARG63257.1 hypothetical protein B1T45_20385 [Mycobacterium kansasii]ARG70892.1 hypothetical protein B1T47_19705 [Mycobacterium kansasii]ARG74551.1 hypothetical protein B1T51_08765 [Mycobacterium kansasii]ARG80009.1 hypothetical protein B1T52_08825 [Mycobacterium kansasii]
MRVEDILAIAVRHLPTPPESCSLHLHAAVIAQILAKKFRPGLPMLAMPERGVAEVEQARNGGADVLVARTAE